MKSYALSRLNLAAGSLIFLICHLLVLSEFVQIKNSALAQNIFNSQEDLEEITDKNIEQYYKDKSESKITIDLDDIEVIEISDVYNLSPDSFNNLEKSQSIPDHKNDVHAENENTLTDLQNESVDEASQCNKVKRSDVGIILDCPGIDVGFKYEDLNNGLDDWREYFIAAQKWIRPDRSIIFGKFRGTNRFNLSDEEFLLGTFIVLDKNRKWGIGLEATTSPSHNVLPEWTIEGKARHSVTNDFSIEFAFRHENFNITEFDKTARFNQERIKLEKEFGSFVAAYTLSLTQVANAGDGTTHLFEGTYYYKQNNNTNPSNVSMKFLVGDIVKDEPQGVFRDNTYAFIIDGKHLFTKNWGVTYNFRIRDEDRYTGIGGGLGIRYEF